MTLCIDSELYLFVRGQILNDWGQYSFVHFL